MVNTNKVNNMKTKQFNKPHYNKHKGVGGGAPYKKPAHGKTAFVKSKEALKNVQYLMKIRKLQACLNVVYIVEKS